MGKLNTVIVGFKFTARLLKPRLRLYRRTRFELELEEFARIARMTKAEMIEQYNQLSALVDK